MLTLFSHVLFVGMIKWRDWWCVCMARRPLVLGCQGFENYLIWISLSEEIFTEDRLSSREEFMDTMQQLQKNSV